MNYSKNLRKKHLNNSMNNIINIENTYIHFFLLILSALIGIHSYENLANMIGILIVMLGFLILFTSLIKENYSQSEGVTITGVAFGVSSVFYISVVSLNFDSCFSLDLVAKLLLSIGYFQALGILLSVIFANRKVDTKGFFYLFIVLVCLVQESIYHLFSNTLYLYVNNQFTMIKKVLELGLFFFYFIILAIIFLKRRYLIKDNDRLCLLFIFTNLLANICSIEFLDVSRELYLVSQVITLISYTLLYRIIANNKIRKSVTEIYNQIDLTNYMLGQKNRTLQDAIDQLEKEIANRKKYERKLKYAEEKYQKIVNTSPEVIYIQYGNEIIYMNDVAKKFFSYKGNESIEGTSIMDIIDDETKPIMQQRLKKTQVDKIDCEPIEITCHCFDGSKKILQVTDIYINLDGKNLTLSRGVDITIKKKLEQEEKRLKEAIEYEKIRSNFFSNISHELRTPVNLIYSSLQLIQMYNKSDNSNPIVDKYYETMKKNCLRLIRLINNIIDITRMDSGCYSPNYSQIEIVSTIEDLTQSVVEYIKDRDISIVFDTDVEEKKMNVDKVLLERMLLNILSNSVKFSKEKGNIAIMLSDKGEGIEIKIQDDGVGIPKENLATIFDKFMQVDKSLRRNTEGSGLGLAIAKSIVDIHKGKITIDSNEKGGCTTVVYIPDKKVVYSEELGQIFESKNTQLINTYNEIAAETEDIKYINKKQLKEQIILEFSDIY
ncbi:MAG: PAS domain S-box protein [Clostridiales bacterium]|nr:PAS domain S-box protein [Clostridiales bacterium]